MIKFAVLSVATLWIYAISVTRAAGTCNFDQDASEKCYHGQVEEDECVCEDGWDGPECEHCIGRFLEDSQSGCISDGYYNHSRIANCEWLIKLNSTSPEVNQTLKISFANEKIDCDGVSLLVYDGEGASAPLLASFSPLIKPGSVDEMTVIASSGAAFLVFEGQFTTLAGYNISYEYTSDEYEAPSLGETPTTTVPHDNLLYHVWTNLTAQGRASVGMAKFGDYMYVYSGKIFGAESKREQMLRFDIRSLAVDAVKSDSTPRARSGHTMVPYQDTLLVFGGLALDDYSVTNELWSFNVSSNTWSQINSGESTPSLYGHTAHLVELNNNSSVMVVIFGYNPDWRYSNFVFHYDIETNTWERVDTSGAIVYGAFGHASALDPEMNKIYVHGGNKYNQATENDVYIYDVEEKSWGRLSSFKTNSRFLHSMVFINGSLLVYGGRTLENYFECEAMPFESYHIATDTWKDLGPSIAESLPRFGHSSIADESGSKMYVYGGFDGIMHSDLFSYEIATNSCVNLNDTECSRSPFCSWTNGTCNELNCSMSEFDCNAFCQSHYICADCLSTSLQCCSCHYCENMGICSSSTRSICNSTISVAQNCSVDLTQARICASQKTCASCGEVAGCRWTGSSCRKDNATFTCQESIQNYTDCHSCTEAYYTWCESTQTCLLSNDYSTYYPYGSCNDLRTRGQCNDQCSFSTNCDDCLYKQPMCGWCSLNDSTGVGSCMSGYYEGPLNQDQCQGNWHFLECPDCQCNGHSTCLNESVCANCTSNTEGETCNQCDDGYYGNPVNGGNCSECQCNGNADTCDSNGICNCNVYAVTGDHCQDCDSSKSISGNAVNDTCFYNIEPGFRYKFGLPSPTIKMNFQFCPDTRSDLLMIIDSGSTQLLPDYYDVIVTKKSPGSVNETEYRSFQNVTYVRVVIYHSSFNFNEYPGTCARVYMTFEPTFTFYIQLQESPFSLGLLIGIIAAVFVFLLLAAVLFWRINIMWIRYRRRRQREVELREMAERPYAHIEFDYSEIDGEEKSPTHFADQGACDGGEAVGSVLLFVPCGDNPEEKESTLAIGTTLVKSKRTFRDKAKMAISRKRNREKIQSSSIGFDNPVMELEVESENTNSNAVSS